MRLDLETIIISLCYHSRCGAACAGVRPCLWRVPPNKSVQVTDEGFDFAFQVSSDEKIHLIVVDNGSFQF